MCHPLGRRCVRVKGPYWIISNEKTNDERRKRYGGLMGLLTKLRLIVLSYQTKFDLKGISWKGGLVKLE